MCSSKAVFKSFPSSSSFLCKHTRPAHFTVWHLIKKHPSTRDAQYISVSVYRHPLSSSSSPSCIDGTNRYTVRPAAATHSLHLCSGVFQAVSVCPCARGLISNLPAPREACGCAGSPAARQKRRPCQPSAVTRLCLIDVRDALRRADGERHYAPLRQRISLRFAPSGWRVAAHFRSRLHENFPIYTTLRVIRTISPRGSTVVLDGEPPGAQETYIPLFLGRFRSAPSSILSVARQSDGMRRQKQQSLQPSPPSPACLSSRPGSGIP